MAERLEETLRLRRWTQRELSRRAGLSDSHVGQILLRARRGSEVAADPETLDAIARAASVSPTWLRSGDGLRDVTHAPTVDPMARIAIALERIADTLDSIALAEVNRGSAS